MNLLKNSRNLAAMLLIFLFALATDLSAQPLGDLELLVYDVQTEEVMQISDYSNFGFFNPSFSNDGKTIICDAVNANSFEQFLVYFDVATGAPFVNLYGNDPSWSPNGNWIVYDWGTPDGNSYGLYLVAPYGEYPTYLRDLGVDAEWSNDSKHLVFADWTMNSALKTLNIDTGVETLVAPFGANPSWSPNGKYIAFTDGNNLFTIRVNQKGEPIGPITQITFDPPGIGNQQPSWSNNSQTIVFHSNRGGADFDLWTIPTNGGTPTLLTGMPGAGDYDPCYSKNGRYVAYAGVPPVEERSVGEPTAVTPDFKSLQNFPNPFREMTTIPVELQEAASLDLRIYDAKGSLVRILASGEYAAGTHSFEWNGTGQSGQVLPEGVYTYTLKVGERVISHQMMMLGR